MHLHGFNDKPNEYNGMFKYYFYFHFSSSSFISHDFVNEIGWMRTTATDWVYHADCNVCIVDWSRLSNYNYNIAASKHTKMVADALVNFMDFLIKHGMDIEQTAIAGHSLGAQVAGLVGAKFNGKIDAIYGMSRRLQSINKSYRRFKSMFRLSESLKPSTLRVHPLHFRLIMVLNIGSIQVMQNMCNVFIQLVTHWARQLNVAMGILC